MFIKSLYLQNFRSYQEAYFEFSPYLNIIVGPNAKGKTTLLEAIQLSILGRSFRTRNPLDMIRIKEKSFFLELQFEKYEVEQTLKIHFVDGEKKIFLNSTLLPSATNLLGILPAVIQLPDDVQLIKGSPQLRRQFLDLQIAQLNPLYVHHLKRFYLGMRHRNQLLRQKHLVDIEIWEYEMARSAAYLVGMRENTLQKLEVLAKDLYQKLTGENQALKINYKTSASLGSNREELIGYFQNQYHKNRERESVLGYTFVGPHKDDFGLSVEGLDVKSFASEGQMRSLMTTLHFAKWHSLYLLSVEKPLFLLDDLGISLDHQRIEKLLTLFSTVGQVFITTTNLELFNYGSSEKKIINLL